jgi:solute carrier family 34 (sodium-dependent phosphate cotransporter)
MTHTLITSRAIFNNPKAADLLTDDLQRQRVTQAALAASKFYARHETAIDITRITLLIYIFLVALSVIGNSAKAIGARSFTEFFAFANDPAMAIAVGLATTVAFQSSSTVTSLITTLVGAGVFSKNIAQYMVFGANLGTTVTNGLVSLLWSCKMNKKEFADRFSKATVHDIFNIWSLIFGVTLQASCGFFNWTTEAMTKHLTNGDNNDRGEKVNFLKLLTGPLSKLILSVDKNAMKAIAKNSNSKTCFKTIIKQGVFSGMIWTDEGKGLATLAASIAALSYSLYKITRITDKMIHQLHDSHNANPQASCITKLDRAYKKATAGCKNTNPAVTNYCKGYATILASVGLTILAQSSSVITSLLTVLLFEKKINDKIFLEAVIGANIGTVFSSMMAAWSAKTHAKDALQVAFTHLLFNLIGLAILYPIPKIRDFTLTQPTKYIEKLLNKSKAFGPLYLFSLYIALPALVLLIGHASQNNVAHSNNEIFNSTNNNSSITFNDPEFFNCSTLKL